MVGFSSQLQVITYLGSSWGIQCLIQSDCLLAKSTIHLEGKNVIAHGRLVLLARNLDARYWRTFEEDTVDPL